MNECVDEWADGQKDAWMNETGPNEDEQGRVNVYGTNKWICDFLD